MQSKGGSRPLAMEGSSMPRERSTDPGSRPCRMPGMPSRLSTSIRYRAARCADAYRRSR